MNKKANATIIAALIGGICAIIAAIIGNNAGKENATKDIINQVTNNVNIDSIDELITEYKQIINDLSEIKEKNLELESENKSLVSENEILNSKNESLNAQKEQYLSSSNNNSILKDENESLKNEINELRSEIQSLKNNNQEQETQNAPDLSSSDIQFGEKVSIFDMETFRGGNGWEIATYKSDYTDTYGNEYIPSYIAQHYASEKNDRFMPTYLLDKKYSICEGQIAWTKRCKNSDEKAWIDFYSDDKLIYSTDKITATDRALNFSFSIENLDTLTIIQNSTKEADLDFANYVYIIYPYLNLVE